MAYTKPSGVNSLWAASGDKTTVPPAKVSAGWVAEKPSFQYFNQILYNLGLYDAYNNERGIPEWDDETEYQATKSYVVGSDGDVYKCLVTNDDVDPTTDDGTNWLQVWNNQGVVKWNIATTYTESAIVRYTDGESYVCHTPQPAGTLPTDFSAFINLKYFGAYAYAVSQLANGDDSAVGFIYLGQTIDSYDYLIYEDGRIYDRNGATGTSSSAFNPVLGTATGVSGVLVNKSQSEKMDKAGLDLLTGSAAFSNSTNNVSMTGIGLLGLEIGDVVEFKDSALNTGYFTLEIITDDDNHVFNYEHRGGTTSKAFVDETIDITLSLISKWNVASIGLGRGWCTPASARALSGVYTNNTRRDLQVDVTVISSNISNLLGFVSNLSVPIKRIYLPTGNTTPLSLTTPLSSPYKFEASLSTITYWSELR